MKQHHHGIAHKVVGQTKAKNRGDKKSPPLQTNFKGAWKIQSQNSGVSAMHMQLMPLNNKAVWFDTIELGPSGLLFNPPTCRKSQKNPKVPDCYAHGVEYDTLSGNIRPLKLNYDPWCSSGGLSADGDLISTGGDVAGARAVRRLNNCENCDFVEKANILGSFRWYASQQILADGRIAVIGGRKAPSFEVISPNMNFPIKLHPLPLLVETNDPVENNLYPFVYLLPDGNLFVFASYKSIVLNPDTGATVRTFPDLAGGARNYPSSGMSALLPLKLNPNSTDESVKVEVLICGGNRRDAFRYSNVEPRVFFDANKDCGRMTVSDANPVWEKEDMPSPRVAGDMLLLPTGNVLLLNGAKKGTSGWSCADVPNLTPVLYSPDKPNGQRFTELQAGTIPRMYHSTAAVLPSGEILIAGSNTNPAYDFKAKFPTELRTEIFTPPYLAPEFDQYRPEILEHITDKALKYGEQFKVYVNVDKRIKKANIKITLLAPPFTTHGFSQNQRLVDLGLIDVKRGVITAMAPPSSRIAPPGYYMLFVVNRMVPSKAIWVKL